MNCRNLIIIMISTLALFSCSEKKESKATTSLSTDTLLADSASTSTKDSVAKGVAKSTDSDAMRKGSKRVNIYFFHSEHKCATCIAIEKVVNEVLGESFSVETKSGLVKLYNINADDEANNSICDKYEAFGTSLFVTGVDGSKEEAVDLTAQSFKLARNNKDQLKSILKTEISKKL